MTAPKEKRNKKKMKKKRVFLAKIDLTITVKKLKFSMRFLSDSHRGIVKLYNDVTYINTIIVSNNLKIVLIKLYLSL